MNVLEEVYIYFDTATYDEIERDVKVTLNSAFDFVFNIKAQWTGD